MPNNDMNGNQTTEPAATTGQENQQTASQQTGTEGVPSQPQGVQETILGSQQTQQYDFASIVNESGDVFDQGAADAFSEVCRESGLTQEQAAGMAKYGIGLLNNAMAAAEAKVAEAMAQEVKDWGDQTAKELGASYNETVGKAAKAMNFIERQAPGFVEMLGVTGAGSHPAMIKALAAFSALLGEDGGKSGQASGGADTYGNTDFNRYK